VCQEFASSHSLYVSAFTLLQSLLGLASFLGPLFVLDFFEILFQRGRMRDQSKLRVNIGREF
jgi:hypothetical protein